MRGKEKNLAIERNIYSVNICVRQCLSIVYLVRDVLLLRRGVTFGVNESGVSHQVASVLHYEAPGMGINQLKLKLS